MKLANIGGPASSKAAGGGDDDAPAAATTKRQLYRPRDEVVPLSEALLWELTKVSGTTPLSISLVARALARRRDTPNGDCELLEAHRDHMAASIFRDVQRESVHPRLQTPDLAPFHSAFQAIGVALRTSFCAADRERYKMLGVFKEQTAVPELLLRRAWNFPDPADDPSGEDPCQSLLRAFHQAVRDGRERRARRRPRPPVTLRICLLSRT